jgi:putative SOS response-associated peptidase YedK
MCFATSAVLKSKLVKKDFNATISATDFPNASIAQDGSVDLNMYHINGFTHPKIPVITNKQPDLVQGYHWGLIPNWTKDEEQAQALRNVTLNAKSETLFEKSSFKDAALTNRCIVLVSGFFEWKTVGKDKVPHYIYCPDTPILPLAGLYSTWVNPINQEQVNTVTIVTTAANELMVEIHNTKQRMPVILRNHHVNAWLDSATNSAIAQTIAQEIFKPFDANAMHAYEISKLISARNQDTNVAEVLTPFKSSLF